MNHFIKRSLAVVCITLVILYGLPHIATISLQSYIKRNVETISIDGLKVSYRTITIKHLEWDENIKADSVIIHWSPWFFWKREYLIRSISVDRLATMPSDSKGQGNVDAFNIHLPSFHINQLIYNNHVVPGIDGSVFLEQNKIIVNVSIFNQQVHSAIQAVKKETQEWEGQWDLVHDENILTIPFRLNRDHQFTAKEAYFKNKPLKAFSLMLNDQTYKVMIRSSIMNIDGNGSFKKGQFKGDINNKKIHLKHDDNRFKFNIRAKDINANVQYNQRLTGRIQFQNFIYSDITLNGVSSLTGDLNQLNATIQYQVSIAQLKYFINGRFSFLKDETCLGNLKISKENQSVSLKFSGPVRAPLIQTILQIDQHSLKFEAQPKFYSSYVEYLLKPLGIKNNTWQLDTSEPIIINQAGIEIGKQVFRHPLYGALTINGQFKYDVYKSYFNIKFNTLRLVDFSRLLMSDSKIRTLKFKGNISYVWFYDPKMPTDFVFQFDDLILRFILFQSDQLPFLLEANVIGGTGNIKYYDNKWILDGKLKTEQGGEVILQDVINKPIILKNVFVRDQRNKNFVTANGSINTLNPYDFDIDIDITNGQLMVPSYFPSLDNPLQMEPTRSDYRGIIHVNLVNPVPVNILGLIGEAVGQVDIIKSDESWLGKGQLRLQPGARFEKLGRKVFLKDVFISFYESSLLDPFVHLILERKEIMLTMQRNITSYVEEVLGIEITGRLSNYRFTLYSDPPGVPDIVIIQSLMINPVLLDSNYRKKHSKNVFDALFSQVRGGGIIPVDSISFTPARPADDIVDPNISGASFSMSKFINRSLSLHARVGAMPQDNIISLIYRWARKQFATQLYTNYQASGINLIWSR